MFFRLERLFLIMYHIIINSKWHKGLNSRNWANSLSSRMLSSLGPTSYYQISNRVKNKPKKLNPNERSDVLFTMRQIIRQQTRWTTKMITLYDSVRRARRFWNLKIWRNVSNIHIYWSNKKQLRLLSTSAPKVALENI